MKILLTQAFISIIITLFCSHSTANERADVDEHLFRVLLYDHPGTMDPQKSSRTIDQELAQHIFDPLFTINNGEAIPILVEDYRWLTPTRWHFTLKQGILFHDDTELTTQDIVATFKRAFRLKNNAYRNIKDSNIRALSRYRFQIDTKQPNSELLWDLEDIRVIKHTAQEADSRAFDDGSQLIGTGPYRLTHRDGFRQFYLEAFEDYHRGTPFLKKISIRGEPAPLKRMDTFLAGKADLISRIPDEQIARLKNKNNITNKTSHSLYLLSPDTTKRPPPDITDHSNQPLTKNPLSDLRVRQAISKVLDRKKLIQELYGSLAEGREAGQFVQHKSEWASPSISPEKHDIPAARKLMQEAGYAEGFRMIIRDKIGRRHFLEKIAPMLKDINIDAKIRTLPAKEYFKKSHNHEFSAPFTGYTTDGNLANMLKQLVYSDSNVNAGDYRNKIVDKQIDHAMSQTSETLKKRALHQAQNTALADQAIIPLFFLSNNWAISSEYIFRPTDQNYTEAYYVAPLKATQP